MEAYQERVIAERKELSEKLDKLRTFSNGAVWRLLPWQDRELLTRQYVFMLSYLSVLDERIARWEKQCL